MEFGSSLKEKKEVGSKPKGPNKFEVQKIFDFLIL